MRILLASIYPYAYFLLLLIIPFDDYVRALPNILLGIIIVAFPFVIKKEDFKKVRKVPATLFLTVIAAITGISLFQGNLTENWSVLSKIMLAAGLLLLYLPIPDFNKVYKAIIFSSLLAILISVFNILMVVKDTGSFDMWHPLNPMDSLLIERLYLGLLCVLSCIVSYRSMTPKYSPENKYYLANIIINVAFVVLIVSRFAILALIVLGLIRLFYGRFNVTRVLVTLAVIGLLGTLAFYFSGNIKKRFFYISPENTQEQPLLKKTITAEPRTIIWECAAAITKTNDIIWTGLGFETTKQKLIDCYKTIEKEGKRDNFLKKRFNTHNQFIDFHLSTGVAPVVLFLLFFVVVLFLIRKKYGLVSICFTVLFFCSIENIFHRQMGAYYFGILLILLLIDVPKLKTETPKEITS